MSHDLRFQNNLLLRAFHNTHKPHLQGDLIEMMLGHSQVLENPKEYPFNKIRRLKTTNVTSNLYFQPQEVRKQIPPIQGFMKQTPINRKRQEILLPQIQELQRYQKPIERRYKPFKMEKRQRSFQIERKYINPTITTQNNIKMTTDDGLEPWNSD